MGTLLRAVLTAGDTYWFERSVPFTAAGGWDWNQSSVDPTGGIWAPVGGGPWTQIFASGPPTIPEPAPVGMLGLGLLAIAYRAATVRERIAAKRPRRALDIE